MNTILSKRRLRYSKYYLYLNTDSEMYFGVKAYENGMYTISIAYKTPSECVARGVFNSHINRALLESKSHLKIIIETDSLETIKEDFPEEFI